MFVINNRNVFSFAGWQEKKTIFLILNLSNENHYMVEIKKSTLVFQKLLISFVKPYIIICQFTFLRIFHHVFQHLRFIDSTFAVSIQ